MTHGPRRRGSHDVHRRRRRHIERKLGTSLSEGGNDSSSSQHCARDSRSPWSWPLLPASVGPQLQCRGGSGAGDRDPCAHGDHRLAGPQHRRFRPPDESRRRSACAQCPALRAALRHHVLPHGPRAITPRSADRSAAPTPCTSLPPSSRPSVSATSPQRPRLLAWSVTIQMWLDLVFLGLVLRIVVNAVKFNQQRRAVDTSD